MGRCDFPYDRHISGESAAMGGAALANVGSQDLSQIGRLPRRAHGGGKDGTGAGVQGAEDTQRHPLAHRFSGKGPMLRRLTPRVERLCRVAEAAGGRTPATPRAIRAPLKPMTKR